LISLPPTVISLAAPGSVPEGTVIVSSAGADVVVVDGLVAADLAAARLVAGCNGSRDASRANTSIVGSICCVGVEFWA
jgi:hypothetical protein